MVRVLLLLLLLLSASFILVPVAEGAECLLCHSAMKGKMEGRKGLVDVHVDGDRFYASVHGVLQCTDCHMGYASGPHSAGADVPAEIAELASRLSAKAAIDPVALAACSVCHPRIYEELRGSVHGRNVFQKKQADGPLCLDCHGPAHYVEPMAAEGSLVNYANIVKMCARCHKDRGLTEKYGVSEDVVEMYGVSFHGKKYKLGHKEVPVCSDCHGAHDITEWDAADSPVFGEGKIKTCGKCHVGATAKFAAAPAHTRVGKDNPIPYYAAKGLTLLVIGTFLFIFAHVLLDMYAEIRDRLLGKGKGGHDE